jgi:hypothetical protein
MPAARARTPLLPGVDRRSPELFVAVIPDCCTTASPESIITAEKIAAPGPLDLWLWIPGSQLKAAPRNDGCTCYRFFFFVFFFAKIAFQFSL